MVGIMMGRKRSGMKKMRCHYNVMDLHSQDSQVTQVTWQSRHCGTSPGMYLV